MTQLQHVVPEDVRIINRLRGLDMNKVRALAESIREVGLLQPITVTPEGVLVTGHHRLQACVLAGMRKVPAIVVELNDLRRELAEIDENLVRNELTTLERCEHEARRKEIYEALHPEARHVNERGGGPGRGKKTDPDSGSVSAVSYLDNTATLTGRGRTTIAEDVQIAAGLDAEVKEKIRSTPIADSKTDLMRLAKMPREEQIKVADKIVAAGDDAKMMQAVREVKRDGLAGRVAALPVGKHRVIYADPPWKYGDERGGLDVADSAAASQYPTMSVEEMCALSDGSRTVRDLAADDAVLFCWATFPLLPDALEVVRAWGFKYKTAIVWDKVRANLGNYHGANAELLLICTRGSCTPDVDKRPDQVQTVERTGRHSEKPEDFRALIDRMYTLGPRVELFRRGEAPSSVVDGVAWTVWGNEAGEAA